MIVLDRLEPYSDDDDNHVVYSGPPVGKVWIRFKGRHNRLIVDDGARLKNLKVFLDSNNGVIEIGASSGVPALSITIRAGEDSAVRIGRDVSSTSQVFVSATEGTEVIVGDDVMFASNNEIRADDAHAVYDVSSGRRVNVSRSIHIGEHVWLGRDVAVLGGVTIGDGTVVGYRSLVTRDLPNNCIAAGIPAKVIRRHVAWERPHLATAPYYRPHAGPGARSRYWNRTDEPATRVLTVRARLRRVLGRAAAGLGLRRGRT